MGLQEEMASHWLGGGRQPALDMLNPEAPMPAARPARRC